MACNKITAAITRHFFGERPIKALLDPYNPSGSTRNVRFNTSKTSRWATSSQHSHINWVVLDSDWEAEFCRVAERHPLVRAYVKNHGLGFEVPYRFGSEMRKYLPDFIVRVDDGRGPEDLLNLIVEIKGYRGEDAVEKKSTMDTYWVPGVNYLGSYGRWAFAEFTDVFQMQHDFSQKIEGEFNKLIASVVGVKDTSSDEFLSNIRRAIFEVLASKQDHVFYLSDIDAAALSANCTHEEVFGVLSMLSSSSEKQLRMKLRSESRGGEEVPVSAFIGNLKKWWRDKSIQQADWDSWAGDIVVSWERVTSAGGGND
ncbi:hypothetical protein [Pseudomonas sp. PIC25]|uniref:hypothetical protein n=1 Tax=Pseudomonas sp. PIC25 TaxID=1958773 RepID=UPI002114CFDC|nr:hypothetical protein [Pseudomonas sp. PIC25]